MCIVKGIPRKNNESTDDIVIKIAIHLNIKIDEKDVDISHRTSTKDDADIIVKFDSRKARNLFYEGRKKMKETPTKTKDLGFEGDTNSDIYINKSLTALNGELLKYTRDQLKKTDQYKYVWTSNGVIKVKKDDSKECKTISVNSKEQVNRLKFNYKQPGNSNSTHLDESRNYEY